MDEMVRAYYDSFGTREWQRLEHDDDGNIEFFLTCHALSSYLPKTARVLDIGGGPGRYTLWLAERGYHVVLADLSPELIKIAQEKKVLFQISRENSLFWQKTIPPHIKTCSISSFIPPAIQLS